MAHENINVTFRLFVKHHGMKITKRTVFYCPKVGTVQLLPPGSVARNIRGLIPPGSVTRNVSPRGRLQGTLGLGVGLGLESRDRIL